MATTEEVVGFIEATAYRPTGTSAAPIDVLVGASTPAEALPFISFVDAADTYADFVIKCGGNYDGGGFTVHLFHGSSVTSGAAYMGVAFRTIEDDAEDVDTTAHTYAFNSAGLTAPSAAGEFTYDTITFTDGADADNFGANDVAIMRIFRDGDGTGGTDDMAGVFRLAGFYITET